ncbi:MAG: type II secretion system F family protein [Deltaproteobacteria bacterium]|nr:MAG: type II secretion system F family protein [Deltaproteobacteria bacterium]
MAISFNQKSSRYAAKAPKALIQRIPRPSRSMIPRFGKTIKPSEMIFFCSQLSLMLEIGTPLTSALQALGNQTKNVAFKEIIQKMHQDIEEGRQLSDAMKRHPQVFDEVLMSMIKAGEAGGFLKKILDRIVEMQEKRQALVAQLRSTLTYPAVLCFVGLVVVVFVLVGVLPKFTTFFKGKESVLPITTQLLMSMSHSLRAYWWAYIIASVGFVLALKLWKDSEPGQALMDRFSVSGPMVSRLYNKIYTCQMLRTLGHLMASQVPLLEALGVTRGTIKNRYFKRFIDQITDHVEQGGRFCQPFANYPYILDSVKQMVATAEEVGNLPKVMLRLAKFYDSEVERELKNLAAMIEPLALIVLGGVVGVIVASVILPLFRLAHAVH